MTINNSDIAIIGLSGRFPGADNIDAFWQNLLQGIESISFFSDEELELVERSVLSHPNYVKAGAVLPNIDKFDASFFGYSNKEAELIDPQQRLFLECAWSALENAGYDPGNYKGLVGVYGGSGTNTYLINNIYTNQRFSPSSTFKEPSLALGLSLENERDYLPTRISYKLNLTGPSINIQTACSTSLVAVHMACQSLFNGECDMALAGGVSISVPQKTGYFYQEDMILSPDGHCRAFDAQARGTLLGSGVGIVVLKLLQEAITDGDNIIAVIKGSAINNDGALKLGFTAPSIEGQAAVISDALAIAQIDASTVTYVETHGTGTALGDPIEITALTQAFRKSTDKKGFCAIGSVKTNFGHLDAAAGIAGLIKTVLALKHKCIPPSLHFKQPNPKIDFANSPFYVNTALSEWQTNGTPRRAGVSSFGMGGTNCHVVLEEAPSIEPATHTLEQDWHILCLSAKTEKALQELQERYVAYLKSHPDTKLADICFTANTGRKHFKHRNSFIAQSVKQLLEQLEAGATASREVTSSPGAIAFLFTGQGSQYVNMGRQLYEQAPTFRETLNRCDEILRPYLEQPLLSVLYPDNPSQNSQLDETAYTQPALFALEYALAQLWKSWGIEPDVVMGHSVGEYVAACLAGVFSLEDGLKLIATRGKLMQALPQDGEMVALLASESQVQEAIAPYSTEVSIAAINAPNSVVISGQCEAINAICATLESSGIKTKKLNVSHAFHSPLMSPMLGEFERVARQVNFSPPKIKLISNVTGKEATLEITTPEYWCRHIRQPVRFARCIESLEEQEIDVFVEIGAKPILLGMARQCLPEHLGLWLPSLRPEREDWQEILSSLAQLYVHGVPVDWVGFNQDYTRRRVPLPTYPFQRQRYWVEAPKDNGTQALALANKPKSSRQHPLLGQKLCLPGTKQIRFQGQISKNFPNWLQDHRVFETTIVPGTAYIEMALAAGAAVRNTENITVENVVIQKALILPDNGSERIIHLVLTPQENLDYTFEIFSLEATADEENEEPQGILHASGTLLVKDNQYRVEMINLATLKSQCQEEVSTEKLYQRYREQNINYGESFQALAQVWRQETVAIGKISLPEKLRAQVGDYQLHPVLLDASLQVLDATFLEDNYQNTYVPIGVERLLFYSQKSADIWCYAQLRQGEDRSQKTISADFRLFAEDGELIALVEGFQLKHAPRDAMLSAKEKSWQDWLYEVEWRPQRQDNPSQDQTPTRLSRDSQKSRNWLIFADGQGTGQQLSRLLHSQGDNCTIIFPAKEYEQISSTEFRIAPANPSHFQQLLQTIPTVQGVVHLWSLDAPEILSVAELEKTSKTSCGSTLHLVQELVKNYTETPRLWLVTRGAQAVNGHPVEQVAQSPLWGMGKVIAVEHPELKCVRVDLDPIATGNDAQILLEEIISSLSAESTEDQVAYRDRARYVPRLVHHRQSQKTLGQTKLDVPENQPFRLEISSRGSLDNLKLLLTTRQKPRAGEIEIRVHSTGLNFRDVLNALSLYPGNPPLGIECAGEVVALGEGVKGFELGESVLGLASGSFSQYVTVDANFVVPKPAALTFEEAATIPEAFFTAYWCLHHVAKISAGDRVLIHAAAGGVGQAAVQLAIEAGAEVFATASPSKWEVLKSQGVKYIMNSRTLDFAEQVMAYTNGQGVDIVLNCLTGEGFVERSLAVVSAKGRFVELAKLDIWNWEQVTSVRPDVQYFAIDMGSACQEQPALVQSMLRQLIQRFENGVLLPLPQTVFPLIDAVSAFRYMQQAKHIGKIVIKFPDKIGTQERLSLRSDGTYLITGGLGGLGLLVAQWLVERGAKHLVLLSRSGLNPSASEQLEKLEQAGACVKVAQADVSDSKQLNCVWSEIEGTLPPLRGIIHAAGVLDEGVLLQLHWQRFERVLAPKVQGAWNLHTLTQNRPLDFFVLFSSATSLLGNAGQANHAAANAFLDALASNRRMLGLPGLSINWGAWAEVGAAARMGLVEHLSGKGEESIAPQQGLQVLEQLLLNPPVQVGVMPVNWSRFLQQRSVLSPFFTDLTAKIQQFGSRSTSVTPQEGDSLKDTMLSVTPAERQQLLESRITEQVARVLGFPATKFDRQESLINLGLDSLMAIELRNRLNNEMGVHLPVMKIMEGVSITSLAEVMLEQWALTQLQSASPSAELDDSMEEIAL